MSRNEVFVRFRIASRRPLSEDQRAFVHALFNASPGAVMRELAIPVGCYRYEASACRAFERVGDRDVAEVRVRFILRERDAARFAYTGDQWAAYIARAWREELTPEERTTWPEADERPLGLADMCEWNMGRWCVFDHELVSVRREPEAPTEPLGESDSDD